MVSVREILRFPAALLLHGFGTGVIGIFIALLIREVQVFSYGSDRGDFLEIDLSTPPLRRFLCVFSGGIFGAFTWYWLRGAQPSIVTVEASLQGKRMPPLVTILNAMIQDIVVALGGSFGREAAPREIAAMWGGSLSDLLGCTSDERMLLVACGTGAGLAAVYSVPISGALYTIEHILKWKLSLKSVSAAVATSLIATYVSSIQVPPKALYEMPKYSYDWPALKMVWWALLIGPLAGLAAMCFRRLVKFVENFKPRTRFPAEFEEIFENQKIRIAGRWGKVSRNSDNEVVVVFNGEEDLQSYSRDAWRKAKPEGERDWRILVVMPLVFLVLAVTAERLPALLGNGRALAELAIARKSSVSIFCCLLILKVLLTAGSIGAGAAGGTLTPSVAIGATLGAIIGEVFRTLCPQIAPSGDLDAPMSVISAASFLAVAMTSPVSGLGLLMEFSGQGVSREDLFAALQGDFAGVIRSKLAIGMLVPMLVAVASGVFAVSCAGKACEYMKPKPSAASVAHPPLRSVTNYDLDLPRSPKKQKRPSEDERPSDCVSAFGGSMRVQKLLQDPVFDALAQDLLGHGMPEASGP